MTRIERINTDLPFVIAGLTRNLYKPVLIRSIRVIRVPLVVLLCSLFFFSCKRAPQPILEEEEFVTGDTIPPTLHFGFCVDSLNVEEYQINPGNNIGSILRNLGFDGAGTERIIRSCREVLDPTKLQAGLKYMTYSSCDSIPQIHYLVFAKSNTNFAVIDLTADTVSSYSYQKEITYRRNYVDGVLTSSLWSSLESQGVSPILAVNISDVYAWEIDFFDVKEGDSYRVIYEEAFIDDTLRLNRHTIQGAVFTHRGKDFIAIPFAQDGVLEYFGEDGRSLRKAFLKAPLDLYRITSRFSNSRFHPVLKRYRAHHGVDYAAPVGTPVKSIGAGVVTAKGYQSGGGGNYVKIKHNSVYTTTYMHLSKFSKGIQVGKTVQQGEVIGYVGSTGLSTGPHLDFRVHKNGKPIDPLKMESPPSEPVKPELLDSFNIVKQEVLLELRASAERNGL